MVVYILPSNAKPLLGLFQWCTGSGSWSPILPDVWIFWIGYRLPYNWTWIIQMK